MKRIFCIIVTTIFMYSVNAQDSSFYIENELIIWLEQGVDAKEFATNSNVRIVPKELLSRRLNIWLFEFTDRVEQRGMQERDMRMNKLSSYTDVKYVQNNYTNITLRATPPNDPYYGDQWALEKIGWTDVWDEFSTTIGSTTSTGDEIVIAVIDDGFDLNHEDLNFWKNTNEIPNNGMDDDNNGYIDDFHGWNAYNNTGIIDIKEHGTKVTGVVGAIGNNGKGVCGVNWKVKILPVIAYESQNVTQANVVKAYSYVLEMRAKYNETNGTSGTFIVATNSSFGINMGNPNIFPIWCSMYDSLGYVGILSCAATANEEWNVDVVGDMPSNCISEFLISTTSTTSDDKKFIGVPNDYGAGYGVNSIDIGAPGTDIYTMLPYNRYGYGGYTGFPSATSYASPHVAGVIALTYAAMQPSMIQAYKSKPADVALLVKKYLLDGADKIPALNGYVASGRRLNAYNSVKSACENFSKLTITNNTTFTGCDNLNVQNVTVSNNAKLTLDAPGNVTINSSFEVQLGSQLEIK